jgi:ubiquinone/menaquinone biosynthesis C-methylase UbiE
VTGVDLSEGMLDLARARASESGRTMRLQTGNAHDLPFDDAAFDTVVCTFGLCAIPDVDAAVGEMSRVLRPGGALILVDHIESPYRVGRGVQRLLELASVPLGGEHFRRRPLRNVEKVGLTIERVERFAGGIVERLVARKPGGQARA